MDNQEAIKWLREAEILDLASGKTKDREAVDLAVEALEKQILNDYFEEVRKHTDIYTEIKTKSDLIERQAALDEIDGFLAADKYYHPYSQGKTIPVEEMRARLKLLPSTQPHSNELSKTQMSLDCISRQAALDAFGLSEKTRKYGGDHSGYNTLMLYEIQMILEDLPSAQPEIIHCKDCKHVIEDALCGGYWCRGKAVTSYHYCGFAERREDK